MSKLIIPTENIQFSKLRGEHLKDLLLDIKDYYLTYRDTLNLSSDETFILKLGYEGIKTSIINNFLVNSKWTLSNDDKLAVGGLIISPELTDNHQTWINLKKICEFLNKEKSLTSFNAHGYIEINKGILGNNLNLWLLFLNLYAYYEHVLYRFGYGDKINNKSSHPIACLLYKDILSKKYESLEELFLSLKKIDKTKAINLEDKIEFRFFNATNEYIIWQNNINAIIKMLIKIKRKEIDFNILKEYSFYKENYYKEIDLQSVLEFIDIIFDNNLDKIYFLRQYLKDYRSGIGLKKTISSSTFIKKK